jgi:hypothetical protein
MTAFVAVAVAVNHHVNVNVHVNGPSINWCGDAILQANDL